MHSSGRLARVSGNTLRAQEPGSPGALARHMPGSPGTLACHRLVRAGAGWQPSLHCAHPRQFWRRATKSPACRVLPGF